MKQSYKLALAFVALLSTPAWSQTKIGNNPTAINANAILELESTNRGFLLPRLNLSATNLPAPLSAHVAGMTVYNLASAGSGNTAVTPGVYYNDGTKWIRSGDPGSVLTLYSGDGSIATNRTVSMGGNNLYLNGTGTVGIGTNVVNSDAVLDLVSGNKGLLLPRLALISTNLAGPLSAHTAGMIIYNTATSGSGNTAVTPGYYFNTGTRWMRIDEQSPTIYNGDGTLSNNRTINMNGKNLYFTGPGYLAINNSNPTSYFDVNGSISFPIRTVSSGVNTTLDSNDFALQITPAVSGAFTVNLPAAINVRDRMYTIVNQSNTAKTVTGYYDLTNTLQTTIPANSSINIQANASGQWVQTGFSYLSTNNSGTLMNTYEATGTTQRLVDATSDKDIDGASVTFTLTSPGKAIISSTVFPAPTSSAASGAIAQGACMINVDGVDVMEGYVSAIKTSGLRISSPTSLTKVVLLAAGPHTIKLRAKAWSGDLIYNYDASLPANGYTGTDATDVDALKSRLTIQVFKQ